MHPVSLGIKFARPSGFYEELKNRVNLYFEFTRKPRRDHPLMYAKAALMLTWLFGAYFLFVFVADSFHEGILYALLLGFGMTGVGFNIQHDANHNAFSKFPLVNRIMGFTLDLLGISSYIWKWKHNSTHHIFTSITGVDEDVEINGLGRLTLLQPYRWYYRFQHIYLWFLYAFTVMSWQWYEDPAKIIRGGLKTRKFPDQSRAGLFLSIVWKLLHLSFAFLIPLLFHPWWTVACGYFFVSMISSVATTVIFQLAHCAEEVRYSPVDPDTQLVPIDWASHQLNTTVDFAPENKVLTWFLGGLNFQIEHHLFPGISHIHYPKLAPIVQATCRNFGLPYRSHATLRAAVVSHYRFLKLMGRPPLVYEAF